MDLAIIILRNTVGYIVLMGILIAIHEYGHFITAKKLGVKILTFSIGFGKPLFSRIGKDGICYQIAVVPLGGYVRMLGEADAEHKSLPKEDQQRTLNAQPLWKRALIVAAGPFFNLALGFLLFWGMYLWGINDLKPQINTPMTGSYLQQAGFQKGDIITSINGQKVEGFNQLPAMFLSTLIDTGRAEVGVKRGATNLEIPIDIGQPLQLNGQSDLNQLLGLDVDIDYSLPAYIAEPQADTPAKKAGLQVDDQIISIDNKPVADWQEMSNLIQATPQNQTITLGIKRSNQILSIQVQAAYNEEAQRSIIGITPAEKAYNEASEAARQQIIDKDLEILVRYGFFSGAKMAMIKTLDASSLIFKTLYRMVTGDIKITAMAGPLGIADIAGRVITTSFIAFMSLVAIVSINIGIINLLPIPVLDGGHLVGYAIKGLVGKDNIPPALGEWSLKIGAVLLFAFMITVIFNDFDKFFGISAFFSHLVSFFGIQ